MTHSEREPSTRLRERRREGGREGERERERGNRIDGVSKSDVMREVGGREGGRGVFYPGLWQWESVCHQIHQL